MIINLSFQNIKYTADLAQPLDISIPLVQGDNNPNCYYAEPVSFETIRSGNFIGSVKEGGSVNYQKITITPHGNGTHSECYGHITHTGHTINKALTKFHFISKLITVTPHLTDFGDQIITEEEVFSMLKEGVPEALILRTLPNNKDKLLRRYSGTNPPYFESNLLKKLREIGVNHLLTDLPSIDREEDGGKLLAHRAFWQQDNELRKDATITELIFVDNKILDGLYLLNLQISPLETDASPSKPVLYKLVKEI